jgi:hypothetical protein
VEGIQRQPFFYYFVSIRKNSKCIQRLVNGR